MYVPLNLLDREVLVRFTIPLTNYTYLSTIPTYYTARLRRRKKNNIFSNDYDHHHQHHYHHDYDYNYDYDLLPHLPT